MLQPSLKMFRSIPLTRYGRTRRYIENLEDNITLRNKKDKAIVQDIRLLIDERIKSLAFLSWFSVILYVLIYFGVISLFIQDFIILDEVANIINYIIGVVGTTLLFILTYGVSRLRELYYGDLTLLSAHLISIYTKEGFDDEKRVFSEINEYEVFLEFFKKRGFMKKEE